MMTYLFHNVYNEELELIDSAPENVECVPFGWSEEIETYRNLKLQELGIGVSSLPSVIAWKNECPIQVEGVDMIIPAHWEEIRLSDIEKENWNWTYINSIIQGWNQ
jgi:hypothetical protein